MTTNNKKILSIAFGIFGFAIRWGIAFLAGQALYIFAEILYYCLLVSPIENPSRDIAAAFSLGFVFALTSLFDMGENGFVPLPPHTALAMVAVLMRSYG